MVEMGKCTIARLTLHCILLYIEPRQAYLPKKRLMTFTIRLLRGHPAAVSLLSLAINIFSSAQAQDFAQEIRGFVGENARQFLQPVADGFMADADAGTFVASSGSDLHIGLQLVVVGAVMGEGRQSFLSIPFSTPVEFQYNGVTFLGDLDIPATILPTAVGMSKSATFSGRLKHVRPKGLPYVPGPYDLIVQDASVTIGGSDDVPIIPALAPQITVGSFASTELVVRFLPRVDLGNAGSIGTFGISILHDVGHYVSSPVDIAVKLGYSSVQMHASTTEADFTADASSVALQAFLSRSFGGHTIAAGPYAVLGIESSTSEINYASADPYLGKQSLSFTSGLQSRIALGAQVRLFMIGLNAEYDIGLVNGFAAGAGIVYEIK